MFDFILFVAVTRKKNTHSKASKNSTTKNPAHKEVIERGKGNGHSHNIALTAAVFFGLAFMFVTIYLVGRRWLEGIRESKSRRSYTRISFLLNGCLLYTSPSPRDKRQSRMPSSA